MEGRKASLPTHNSNVRRLRGVQSPYRKVFESASEAVLFIQADGIIINANSQALKTYGLNADEIAGKCARSLFATKDIYKLDLTLERCFRLGKEAKFKAVHIGKGNRSIYVQVQVKPFGNCGVGGLILFVRDLTEELRAQERLRLAKLEAEASVIAKSHFLANISHEIRTPMNVLLGYAALLKDKSLDFETREEFVDCILKNGDDLIVLIDRILDISKLETGTLKIEKETFALYPALLESLNQVRKQFKEKEIEFTLDFCPKISAQVKTDPIRFKQVLVNILGNAAKFMETGQVNLKAFFSVDEKLVIQVSDTGIGIPKEEWKRLFDPFTQVDESSTRRYGGAGLGLAVSKRFAKAMGGDLFLKRSLPGKGSVFEFWIKRGTACKTSVERGREDPGCEDFLESPGKAKILLVEDVEENRMLIKMYLKNFNCKLDIASDGEEALELVGSRPYDLILMDLQMPKLDGFETTGLLRKSGVETPIIALTAHSLREDVEKCMSWGFNDHISKPVRAEDLLKKVTQLCDARIL